MDAWFTLQGTRGTKNWLLIGIYILEEIYFKTVRYTYQSTCSCIVYTGGGGGGEREREKEWKWWETDRGWAHTVQACLVHARKNNLCAHSLL